MSPWRPWGGWAARAWGFVFGPDRAYTGLDLDHVIHDGLLEEQYRWVVEQAGTYTEVSPSGDGLHLIFRGSKPEGGATRCRRGPVEMYDHDRYFTVTGDVYEGHGAVASRPEVVARAYRTWIEPEAAAAQPTLPEAAGDPADMGDAELVERMLASRNGAAIRALLDGDTEAQGGDHSSADMALCNHLAFWCAGNEARMDRIFRSSGLMRDKWDSGRGGTTYGRQTIERAVANATEFYRPRCCREPGAGRRLSHDTNRCLTVAPRYVQGAFSTPALAEEPMESAFDAAPSVEGWHVDERGRLWTVDREGELRYSVSSTAPWIACDLVDVDTGDVRALVRVAVPGGVRERALDRDVLLNQSRVIGALAPLEANVSSANAKDIVRYMTDCERRLGYERPRYRSVTHMSWASSPLGAFMPYDRDGEEVRFDPAPDELVKARPSWSRPARSTSGSRAWRRPGWPRWRFAA